jgi:hypothetical protein
VPRQQQEAAKNEEVKKIRRSDDTASRAVTKGDDILDPAERLRYNTCFMDGMLS